MKLRPIHVVPLDNLSVFGVFLFPQIHSWLICIVTVYILVSPLFVACIVRALHFPQRRSLMKSPSGNPILFDNYGLVDLNALTSIIAKCMERLVCNQLIKSVANNMDPLQFAYRAKRVVEDATLTMFNLIASHLHTSGTTVRVLFMDFWSAF